MAAESFATVRVEGLAAVIGDLDHLPAEIHGNALAAMARIVRLLRDHLRATKLSINVGLRQLAAGVLEASLAHETVSNLTRDHREAVAAFRDGRAPRFDAAWFDDAHERR